jgi:predicted O-methyltransferase YrrM
VVADLQSEYRGRLRIDSDIRDHLPFLYDTTCRYPIARVLELGTRWGTSTAAFLAAADLVDGHVWSVDIGPVKAPDWWEATGRWTLTLGDDMHPAVRAAQPEQVDVLFIDTSHAYQHTLDELRIYVPRVASGGTVLLHDTELECPEDRDPDDPPFPVARALDTFCEETGMQWSNRDGCWGLGVIEVT